VKYSYGDRDTAFRLFNTLTTDVKANILKADYSVAEKYCPQKIKIGNLLKKTIEELT
jgi:predicted aldo/keto reductase-like oxidoreductase